MSSMSPDAEAPANSPSPRGNAPPHIRLNSGTQDAFASSDTQPRPSSSRSNAPRPLIPPPQSRPGTAPGLRSPASSSSLYQNAGIAESAELLLPPKKTRTRAFRDESPLRPTSALSSRRTSWSSESAGSRASRDSRYGPFASPFDDSRAPSRTGSDEDLNTQTVSEKFNIVPNGGLLLFPEDVEKDDWLHNPDPNEKETRDCDIFNRRGALNIGGLALLSLGLLMLFIGYPIITFVHKVGDGPTIGPCTDNPLCLAGKDNEPLLNNVRTGLIDPDTPDGAKTRKGHDGQTQVLVFSDEFNEDGRTFYDGDDPYWQGVDIWYGATQDLEWYDPDAISTGNGTLNIRFDAFNNHGLQFRSGMLQSWNKMCFKGGHLEASISLPGSGEISGMWPGFWAMGNLGRPGHLATTDGMWPYSYHDDCDVGITPNQSSPDGLNFLPGMRLPACTCEGEDHPNRGKSRSAPEIDALEGSVTFLGPGNENGVGVVSQSFQAAPFDIWYQPDYDFIEVYDRSISHMNDYRGGVYQQAVSGLTNLNNDWYDGKAYQKYSFEYKPGGEGYIVWKVGEDDTWKLDARAMGPNGNIGQRTIPEEPMSIIINFGLSNSFAYVNPSLANLLPATMRVDYVRIYQNEGEEIMTCDPPDYPTTQYIKEHEKAYKNANLTHWDKAGFDWPKNSFMHGCKEAEKEA